MGDMLNRLSHGRLILLLIFLSYIFLMFGNGIISLTHPDEVFYVQTAKEMIKHHSWLVPYIFDEPQFEKPILFYWLLAFGIKLFGLSPFVARFWPAFFGILGVVATYWLAILLFANKRIAFLSGLILSSSFIYLALSRAVLTDMVFSILVVISIAFFYFAYVIPKHKNWGIILCCLFSGLAVLTKGILGLVFPMGTILLYLFYRKDLKFLKTPSVIWGTLLFALIAVPWHIYVYKLFGQGFIDEYVYNVHIRRILEAEHPKSDTWYFYPGMMFAGVFPWSLFLIPSVGLAFNRWRSRGDEKDKFVFLLIMIAVVFFITQNAHSKLASYIFPVFPAIAIFLGYFFGKALEAGKNKWLIFFFYVLSALIFVLALGAIVAGYKYKAMISDMTSVYVFSVLGVLCSALIFILTKLRKYFQAVLSVAGVTVIVLVVLFLGHFMAEPWVSCEGICKVFNNLDQSDSTILCSKFYVRGVRFYTDRKTAVIDSGDGFFSPHPIPYLNNDQKVLNFLNSQPTTYAIVKESNAKDLDRVTKGLFKITYFHKIGGKQIVKIDKI